jgi:hypothetical protein
MRATLQFLAVYLGVFKTLSQDTTAHNIDVTYQFWKPWSCTFTGKKSSLPEAGPAEEIAFEIAEFFQPATFFTEMLRFDKKIQRNFSEISLQLLKFLSIKKREILEKSRKNIIFIISSFNGGHRYDKKSPGVPFMLEIPMFDPLVYSQTSVPCLAVPNVTLAVPNVTLHWPCY